MTDQDIPRIAGDAVDAAEAAGIECFVSVGNSRMFGPWVWVEMGTRIHRCCPTSENGISWDWVDDQGGNMAPSIRGTRGDKCTGCGSYGVGQATTGAVEIDLAGDTDAQVAAIVTAAKERITSARQEAHDDLVESLRVQLRRAVGTEDDDTEVWREDQMTAPGVYLTADGWQAWDFDPLAPGDVIVISEGELS